MLWVGIWTYQDHTLQTGQQANAFSFEDKAIERLELDGVEALRPLAVGLYF